MNRWLSCLFLCGCSSTLAATSDGFAFDIKGASLKELMSLKISSLSKKRDSFNKAPAAVYVLTQDEIQRLGVPHIAEALRYVPGVEVARREANKGSVSIRGFNARTANKLLVMIDCRSVYNPLIWQINTFMRFVDELNALGVDRYCVFDVTANWQPSPAWEVDSDLPSILRGGPTRWH